MWIQAQQGHKNMQQKGQSNWQTHTLQKPRIEPPKHTKEKGEEGDQILARN